MTAPLMLDLWLIESGGPFLKAGGPELFCRMRACHWPGGDVDDAAVSVIARVDGSWQEFAHRVSLEETGHVLAGLVELGFPGRLPDVEGVVDTSDAWSHLLFCVHIGSGPSGVSSLDLAMQSSGFKGGDADRLRGLFRYLFALAGYRSYPHYIYGSD